MDNDILKDSLPAGIRPFDFEVDELAVAIHVVKLEDSLFGFSRDLGAAADVKASGMRLDYDVLRVCSLRDASRSSIVLNLAAAFSGKETQVQSYTIAGVDSTGVLWFQAGDKFMSAADELEARAKIQQEMVGLLGGDFVELLRNLTEKNEPGEEWKNG